MPKPFARNFYDMGEKRRGRPGRPTVDPARAAAMRKVVRQILDTDFRGRQSEAAEKFGFSEATLSTFLSGKTGVGNGIEAGVTSYLRRSFDAIVEHGGDLASLRSGGPPGPPREVRFGNLPEWPDIYRQAREMKPSVPRWAWEMLARARVILDVSVTPAFAAEIAQAIARCIAAPENPPSFDPEDSPPSI